MVAALSIGEFNLSNLLAGFHNRTYPVLLLQAFYGATGFACAATVVLLILASVAALLSSFLCADPNELVFDSVDYLYPGPGRACMAFRCRSTRVSCWP